MDEFNMDFPYEYGIERDGRLISKVYGRPIADGSLINVQERDGIKPMDVAIDTQTGERYSVSEIRPAVINSETVWYVLAVRKVEAQPLPTQSINIGTISGNNASVGNSGMEIRGNTFTSTASTVIDDLKRMAGSVPPDDLPEFFNLVRDLESVERGEKDASGALKPYRSLLDRLTDVGAFVAKLACKFMIL